jgi:hypothetical protein
VVLCLAALTSVFGQAKPTVAPVTPRPLPQVAPSAPPKTTTPEEAPAVVPPAQTNASPPPSIPGLTPVPDKTVTLQFPNSDVVDVLHLYEQLTN